MDDVARVCVQRFQQRSRETSRRSEPGARRYIGEGGDLELRAGQVLQSQSLTNDRMLYVRHLLDALECRVFKINARPKGPHDTDVHVLVDGGRNQEAFASRVIGWQIRATAPEGDAQ